MNKKIYSCFLFSTFFILAFMSASFAQTIRYIKVGGAGDQSGSSWENASGDLQLMIDASTNGDQVWVAGGIYKPVYRADNRSDANPNDRDNAFVMKGGVKVYGGFAGSEISLAERNLALLNNASVLSGDLGIPLDNTDNAYHVVIYIGNAGTGELNGFTITGGNANGTGAVTINGASIVRHIGGGIRVEASSPKLHHLVITKNRATHGGGMANASNSNPEISYVISTENRAQELGGGFINLESSPIIKFVHFVKDSAGQGGGMFNQNSSATIDSVFFESNYASTFGGGLINYLSTIAFKNVVFGRNFATSGGGGMRSLESDVRIENAIFDDNHCQAQGGAIMNVSSTTQVFNGVFYNNTNVFTNEGGAIWNLNATIRVVNATFTKNRQPIGHFGTVQSFYRNLLFWSNTDEDIKGNFSIDYSFSESALAGNNNIQGSEDPFIDIDLPAGHDGVWGTKDDGLRLKLNSPLLNSGTNAPAEAGGILFDIIGRSRVTNTTIDIGAYEENPYKPDPNGVLYVNGSANDPNGDGGSWDEAVPSLEDALIFAQTYPGLAEIWVAEGTYQSSPGLSFVMAEGVKIYGGFNGSETSLSQRNLGAGHNTILMGRGNTVVDNSTNNLSYRAMLDGFIITGGSRGMLNSSSSPTLNNLIFSGNAGFFLGGGMLNVNASPLVSNSVFYNNSTDEMGGGMCNDANSSPILTNLTFVGNKAAIGAGGGLYIDFLSGAQITNLVFWNNTAVFGDDLYYDGNRPTVINYSYLQNLKPGEGNIQGNSDSFVDIENPVGADGKWFTADDGLMLKAGSEAIDAGNNDAVYGTGQTNDITGRIRIQHLKVDMGAYETPLYVVPDANGRLYVKKDATGYGSSWGSSSGELADALKGAAELNAESPGTVKEIWVSGGNYLPAHRSSEASEDSRDVTFLLLKDVKIYGGFAGTESELAERRLDITANASILDGDVGMFQLANDNAYHVVLAAGNMGSAELNGFTIQHGNADGNSFVSVNGQDIFRFSGGGICLVGTSLRLTNLIIAKNAGSYGAGVYHLNSFPISTNLQINDNSATTQGGGIYSRSSAPVLTNVVISGNIAAQGGGIYNSSSNSIIRNSIIHGNNNGIQNDNGSAPIINYSLVQGMAANPAANNFDGNTNPMFVDAASGNFRLQSGSTLINGGNSLIFNSGQDPDLSDILTDIVGNPRVAGPSVDLGVYETLSALPIVLESFSAKAEGSTAKLLWATVSETNNKFFIISRSRDGNIFKEIGRVAGAGNSDLQIDYVFYDKNLSPGNYYYRLQQEDFDGKTVSHGILKVHIMMAINQVKAYPNPIQKLLTVEFPAEAFSSLELISGQGRVVQYFRLGDRESRKLLDLNSLAPGIYYIRLSGRGKVELRKLIRQ